uniref:Uncharacterized protein n=1 Tax=Plectus sambesii TaxID=2011161 RepID=A0A914X473_9BILA
MLRSAAGGRILPTQPTPLRRRARAEMAKEGGGSVEDPPPCAHITRARWAENDDPRCQSYPPPPSLSTEEGKARKSPIGRPTKMRARSVDIA